MPSTKPDPTTIKQTKISQFAKHVEILDEQYTDKEIDVPVMLQRNYQTVQQRRPFTEDSGDASGAVCRHS